MIAITRRWPPHADGSSRPRVESAAIWAISWSSTRPRRATSGRCPITRSTTFRLTDVREGFLRDENHPQKIQLGSSRLHSLVGAAMKYEKAARVFDDGPVAGMVRFEWDHLRWFEEDEPIYGHPRNPYARVDALRSHRNIRVELDGVVLADTAAPVLLFETGLPTRYYIDPTDVAFEHLEQSATETLCPYKGTTSGYWSVRAGDTVHPDLAWTYHYPLPAVAAIAGLVAFYNEKLDIIIDGAALARPKTQFS